MVNWAKSIASLEGKVESEIAKCIQEREQLGLGVPTNYRVYIRFYSTQGAKAIAQSNEESKRIIICVAPSVLEKSNAEYAEKLRTIMRYFDMVRDFLIEQEEEFIFEVIEHPVKAMRLFEKSCSSKKDLEDYKEFLKQRGTSYETYKGALVGSSKGIRTLLKGLFPTIKSTFESTDLDSLRHELDHVDLFDSPMFRSDNRLAKEAHDLGQKFHSEEGSVSSSEYAKAKIAALRSTAEVVPILEARALFFDHIAPNQWKDTNFSDAKNLVLSDFIYNYLKDRIRVAILDALVSQSWAKGEMDRETSNYLFRIVHSERGSPDALRYVVKPEKVNYDAANRILYREIPEWQYIFTVNAQTAVEAIGNAFRDNPARLAKTKRARTFDEFIELCEQE